MKTTRRISVLPAALLAAALAFCCVSASAERADIFTADVFLPIVNMVSSDLVGYLEQQGLTAEQADAYRSYLTLSVSEAVGGALYCDNTDWSYEMVFYAHQRDADPSRPADTVTLAVPEDAPDTIRDLMATSFAIALTLCEESLDITEIAAWLDETDFDADAMPLFDGYLLVTMKLDGHYQYGVLTGLETE